MKQKSKVHWFKCKDGNNEYFHASLKSRTTRGTSAFFTNDSIKLVDANDIQQEVLRFYKGLLDSPAHTDRDVDLAVVHSGPLVVSDAMRDLVRVVHTSEIVEALKSIGDSRWFFC